MNIINSNAIDSVFNIAEKFMKHPKYVKIDKSKVDYLVRILTLHYGYSFYRDLNPNVYKVTMIELIASSINYCYWYGKHDIRPKFSSSTILYNTLTECFKEYHKPDETLFKYSMKKYKEILSINRFPLIEEREKHLLEVLHYGESFVKSLTDNSNTKDIKYWFNRLISEFTGFGSDLFLKRASLFFIQLHKLLNLFKDEISLLPIPADYQIPKVLQYHGCIKYNKELINIIKKDELIPKYSVMECEIRAATILVCKELQKRTQFSITEIDCFLYEQKGNIVTPHHLTVTTDY